MDNSATINNTYIIGQVSRLISQRHFIRVLNSIKYEVNLSTQRIVSNSFIRIFYKRTGRLVPDIVSAQ